MIPLAVVMLDVFTNGLPERPPSEEDHAVEALRFQTTKPSLHVGVQVGTLGWQQNDFSVRVLLQEFPHGDEARIAIHNEMLGVFQESVFAIGEIAADLFHPRGIRTWRDPGNVDATGFQMHHSENVERHQSVPVGSKNRTDPQAL